MHLLPATFLTILLVVQALTQYDGKPCEAVDGGSHVLTSEMKSMLASRYRSWQVRHQCVGEAADIPLLRKIDPVAQRQGHQLYVVRLTTV